MIFARQTLAFQELHERVAEKTSMRIETYPRLEMFCTLDLAAIERQQARRDRMLVGPYTVLALAQYVGIGDYLRNCLGNTEPDNG